MQPLSVSGFRGRNCSWDRIWIGWQLCYRAGTVRVPDIKRHKLRSLIRPLLTDGRVELKAIQQVLGLLQWVTQLHIALRPWPSSLYDDLSRPPGTSYSIAPAFWDTLAPCLSEALIFTATPQGTAIPVGSKLFECSPCTFGVQGRSAKSAADSETCLAQGGRSTIQISANFFVEQAIVTILV